jgi:hypothetical protein
VCDYDTTDPVRYKNIPGYSGYKVGTDGSVWTKKMLGRWRKLKTGPWKGNSYCIATLGNSKYGEGRKARYIKVHTLVLMVFVGPCPDGMECRHLNGDSTDNRLTNLCWGTPKKNTQDRWDHGTMFCGSKHPWAILNEDQVREIKCKLRDGERIKDVAVTYGVRPDVISAIKHGKSWKHVKV